MTGNPVLIYGAGRQARLYEAMLLEAEGGADFLFGAGRDNADYETRARFGSTVGELADFLKACAGFVVAIGNEYGYARCAIADAIAARSSAVPLSLVHTTAFIEKTAYTGEGFVAMPGVVVHKFTRIGRHCILNTRCCIDHECEIGDGVHAMGGAAIAGGVKIDDFATIGTNATVLPDVHIGSGAYVGAGAVVTKAVAPGTVVAGVPAQRIGTLDRRVDLTPFDDIPIRP